MKKYLIIFFTVFTLFFSFFFIDAYAINETTLPAALDYQLTGYTDKIQYWFDVNQNGQFNQGEYVKTIYFNRQAGKTYKMEIYWRSSSSDYAIAILENNTTQVTMAGQNRWYYNSDGGATGQDITGSISNLWNGGGTRPQDLIEVISSTIPITLKESDGTITTSYTPPPTIVDVNEYAKITFPYYDNWKTVDKAIACSYIYKIKTNGNINDINISVKDINNVSYQGQTGVLSISEDTTQSRYSYVDGYAIGSGTIIVKFAKSIVGEHGFDIEVKSISENKVFTDTRLFELIAFTDSNQDGLDDSTGETNIIDEQLESVTDGAPNREDPKYTDDILGNIKFGFDTILYYITSPFKWIGQSVITIVKWMEESVTWISSINLFFGSFVSFLPPEIVSSLTVLLIVIVIFSIFRIWRH